jgi:hypothetical protein
MGKLLLSYTAANWKTVVAGLALIVIDIVFVEGRVTEAHCTEIIAILAGLGLIASRSK